MATSETQVLTVRMPKDEHEALRGYAFATGASMNDVVLRALRDFLSGPGRREEFDALLSKARKQYRVALDKLVDL
jgi:NRPS condensation-like uncharacterized protein